VAGRATGKANANVFAAKMRPVIEAVQARGIVELKGIAEELTRQRFPTARGGDEWSIMGVKRILERERFSSVDRQS
jgi:hypothetical protein